MSFNKNLVVAGFTLALLIASSYGDLPETMASSHDGIMAGNYCYESTRIACTSDETCRTACLRRGEPLVVGGYCFKASCMCIKRCVARIRRHGAATAPAAA